MCVSERTLGPVRATRERARLLGADTWCHGDPDDHAQLRRPPEPHDADTSVANDIIRQIAVAGDPGVVLLDLDREISAALQPHFQDVVHLEEPGRQIKADHIGAAILHHLGSQATETASPPKVFVDD